MTPASNTLSRRRLIQAGFTLPIGWSSRALAANEDPKSRILVIVELSGGNDGLNTVVPYSDDTYYRLRPNLAIRPQEVLRIDDHFGFNPGLAGLQRLWQQGDLAIVHGCGYANPSFSHFTSMAYWHTAAPNSGDEFGWVGRLADTALPVPSPNALINIGASQSLAVNSRRHNPVVFDDPARFKRNAFAATNEMLQAPSTPIPHNPAADYLRSVATAAHEASGLIRAAWSRYRTNVDYGIAPLDLDKVAACIAADLPTRIYYVSFRNNAFDTHVQQPALHRRLLTYAADAISAFLMDIEHMGAADRVVMMAFSEFGRRVPENTSLGTDHGAAGPMFMAGRPVRGGHYGKIPSLSALDTGDNLAYTTDFRRVYATAIDQWIAPGASKRVLNGAFETLPIIAG